MLRIDPQDAPTRQSALPEKPARPPVPPLPLPLPGFEAIVRIAIGLVGPQVLHCGQRSQVVLRAVWTASPKGRVLADEFAEESLGEAFRCVVVDLPSGCDHAADTHLDELARQAAGKAIGVLQR